MDLDMRFKRHGDGWHARRQRGMTPADFIAECSDETLVELLAYSAEGSAVERNIIATELTNRISRLHRSVASHSDAVRGHLDENQRALGRAQQADDVIRLDTDTFQAATDKASRYSKTRKEPREGGW